MKIKAVKRACRFQKWLNYKCHQCLKQIWYNRTSTICYWTSQSRKWYSGRKRSQTGRYLIPWWCTESIERLIQFFRKGDIQSHFITNERYIGDYNKICEISSEIVPMWNAFGTLRFVFKLDDPLIPKIPI